MADQSIEIGTLDSLQTEEVERSLIVSCGTPSEKEDCFVYDDGLGLGHAASLILVHGNRGLAAV